MIYLLTNVAKTQNVPLDGTIFSGNTGQKDRATFMNKNIPIHYPKLSRTNLQASETERGCKHVLVSYQIMA